MNFEKEKRNSQIIDYINQAKDFSKNYDYHSALERLQNALSIDIENEFKIEILILLAQTHEFLSEFDNAKKYYNKLLKKENIRLKDVFIMTLDALGNYNIVQKDS